MSNETKDANPFTQFSMDELRIMLQAFGKLTPYDNERRIYSTLKTDLLFALAAKQGTKGGTHKMSDQRFYAAVLVDNQDQELEVEWDLLEPVVQKAAVEMLVRYPDYTILVYEQLSANKLGKCVWSVRK